MKTIHKGEKQGVKLVFSPKLLMSCSVSPQVLDLPLVFFLQWKLCQHEMLQSCELINDHNWDKEHRDAANGMDGPLA
jgi:hypothetical protein